jgi:Holliday junction resolvasome RuvABC DNA-binding subunit
MNKLMTVLVCMLTLVACQKQEPIKTTEDTGRSETRNIEAADAMGYNGKQIRKKVDGALDANDAHNAQLEQQMNEQ